MNLRRRFIMLIIGVLVIPVLVIGLSFMLLNNYMSIKSPRTTTQKFSRSIENLESIEHFSEISDNLEESYFAILLEVPEIIASTDNEKLGRAFCR